MAPYLRSQKQWGLVVAKVLGVAEDCPLWESLESSRPLAQHSSSIGRAARAKQRAFPFGIGGLKCRGG